MNSIVVTIRRKLINGLLLAGLLFSCTNLYAQAQTGAELRKEIITLDYHLRVLAADAFVNNMINYAKAHKGYLVSLTSGSIVLRIPVEIGRQNIDQKIASLSGTHIYKVSRQNDDVSARIVELRSQLKASSNNLEKLRELSATTGLDDLLDLEEALSESLEQVDNLKGEIRYLEDSATLYLVNIQMNSQIATSDPQKVPVEWIRNLGIHGLTGEKQ